MRMAWKWAVVSILTGLCGLGSLAWSGVRTIDIAFKTGAPIDVRQANEQGLRLDAVQFDLPGKGPLGREVGARLEAQVAVTNTAETAQRTGVAIALFDDAGRLLGVASGGGRLMALRPGQQKFYTLDFEHVTAEAHKATRFRISIESR